jgi:tetratricopeptide (TPR) repeat protein
MTSVLFALVVLLTATVPAHAQSPLVAELRRVSVRYHEDPSRLDTLREGLEQAAAADPRPENLVALAQIEFIWADIRAKTQDGKLKAYDTGRQAAKRAAEADPRNVVARFWYATNTARWGQTNGVVRSLFLLPEVKREIGAILEIDARFTPVYVLAGSVYYEVPALLGGDLGKSEELFRKGLELDPRYTMLRVGLGKTLIKLGRADEARRELTAVVEEKAPRNLADWTMKDVPEAKKLLEGIRPTGG